MPACIYRLGTVYTLTYIYRLIVDKVNECLIYRSIQIIGHQNQKVGVVILISLLTIKTVGLHLDSCYITEYPDGFGSGR